MSKQMIVLFYTRNFVGPTNAAIGIGQVLKDSGHKVVFVVNNEWTGKLKIHGFEEEIIGNEDVFENKGSKEENEMDLHLMLRNESRLQKIKLFNKLLINKSFDGIIKEVPFFEAIIKRVKPDLIFIEFGCIPFIMSLKIPWVLYMSNNPLSFDWLMFEDKLPPNCLGLPTNGCPEEWIPIRKELNDSIHEFWTNYNNWVVSKGYPSLPVDKIGVISPYLNIYMFPKELDYSDIRPYPPNFVGFDCFKRTGVEEVFELPEKLKNRSGKLIYLSMGSIGSGNVELMKRLVSILSKSKHRIIVSKGPFGDEYELPDNMWGQNYLPQIKLLPVIDLILSHGGNNTLTETLYYGKLILVMPLFLDQFDNSQRLIEKGLSIELNPFECSETDLLESIEKLLNDKTIQQKMTAISKRIQSEQNILKLPQLLLNLIK